jgi:hypothetical protein
MACMLLFSKIIFISIIIAIPAPSEIKKNPLTGEGFEDNQT